MGKHTAGKGQPGRLRDADLIGPIGQGTGRHRADRLTEATDPELGPVEPTDDNVEGWRN